MDNEQKLKFLQENFEDKGDKCDIAIRLDVAKQLCNVILGQEAGVVQMGCRHLPVNILDKTFQNWGCSNFIAYVRITMFDYGAVEIQDNYEFLIGHVTSV